MTTVSKLAYPPEQKIAAPSASRWVWHHIARAPGAALLTVLGEMSHAVTSVLTVMVLGRLVDQVLSGRADPSTLWTGAAQLLALVALRFLAGLGVAAGGQILSERVQQRARDEAFQALLSKDAAFQVRERSGDLMSRVTNDAQMLSVMILPGMTMLLASVLSVVVPLAGIALLDVQLLVVPVLLAGIALQLILKYSSGLEGVTWAARSAYGRMNSAASEAVHGMDVIRAHNLQASQQQTFDQSAQHYRQAQLQQAGMEARYLPTLVYAACFALALAHAIWLQRSGQVTVGEVVVFMGLFVQFQNPVSTPLYGLSLVQLGMASAKRILELLQTSAQTAPVPSGPHLGPFVGHVELRGVTLHQPQPLFRDVTLTLQPGERVALIGATGSGKSSLLNVLQGNLHPDAGELLFDGLPRTHWDEPQLRRQVALVEQEPFLFQRSVRENVALGAQRLVTDEEVWQALELAQAAGFVRALPQQLNTALSERGATLSGGQRQRLALARALIGRPTLLLLDDATSALDEETGRQVLQAIRETGLGVVMATNRWSDLEAVDRILVLHGQTMTVFNSLAELLSTDRSQLLAVAQETRGEHE